MTINDINYEATYEGYIWMSNSNGPIVMTGIHLDKTLLEEVNPFVIEGQLYDSDNKKSLSIKYVDGEYLIHSYDLSTKDFDSKNQKQYVSNRMDGRKLKFVQRWKPQDDEFCEGMKALQPSELVFIGFGETINKED
jgi:CRISPR type III-associated protein (TIGR04423 family)